MQKQFSCEEPALEDSGYCVFHDEHFMDYDKHKIAIVHSKFMDNLERDVSKNEEILYVGYNLPAIRIRQEFTKFVSFLR